MGTLGDIASAGLIGDAKGWVENLALDEATASDLGIQHPFRFWFRPDQIEKALSVQYTKLRVLGMSHQYLTYDVTENAAITFELYVNRLMILKERSVETTREMRQRNERSALPGVFREGNGQHMADISYEIEGGLKYLEALAYPPEIGPGIIGGFPPACILCLPGLFTFRARLTGLTISYTEVDLLGNMTEVKAKTTFEVAPLSRITMQEQLDRGNYRTWGSK